MNVLLICDHPQMGERIRALVLNALPDANLGAVTASDRSLPELAQRAAQSDVVLINHQLGAHDSIDLVRAMKARNVRLPVIFVAAGGDEMLVARAFKAGVTDYLPHSRLTRDAVLAAIKESMREQKGVARASSTRAMQEAADDVHIKGYRIDYRLARSALSSVYHARDVRGNRVVALKVMQGFVNQQSSETLERFVREYESASSLNHRNVVRIHDFGFTQEQVYIAMEYLPGGTLRDRMVTDPLTEEACVEVLLQVCEALEAMHAVAILHRDLKPGNIMFHADGTACVIDFGLAKHAQMLQALTVPGRIYGTPYYMSPEQGQGLPMDVRSDLYSLGVLFYEMLCGTKPYAAGSALAMVYKHTHAPIPRLPSARARWQPVIDRLMAKKPADRCGSPRDVRSLVYACKTL